VKEDTWWPINGYGGRLMPKLLITTIQVNLVASPSETWRTQKFTSIVLKILSLTYHHSHFLTTPFDFTSIFTVDF